MVFFLPKIFHHKPFIRIKEYLESKDRRIINVSPALRYSTDEESRAADAIRFINFGISANKLLKMCILLTTRKIIRSKNLLIFTGFVK